MAAGLAIDAIGGGQFQKILPANIHYAVCAVKSAASTNRSWLPRKGLQDGPSPPNHVDSRIMSIRPSQNLG